MSRFLCKTFIFRTSSLVTLQNPNVSSLKIRWFSIGLDRKEDSFTVSYLINSLGFSPQNALSASNYVSFKTSAKPDRAIEVLKSYGFSQTQILRLVRARPRVLVSDAEKIILPKLEFLKSKGLSDPEIAKSLSPFPSILSVSLANRIMPSYDFFTDLFQSEKKAIDAVKRFPDLLCFNFKNVVSNVDILRECGAPVSKIINLIMNRPRCLARSPVRFQEMVEEVLEMGFDVSTTTFSMALHALTGISESTRKRKVETYKKCGFSEEEVSKIFRSYPPTMLISDGNISAKMDFFVNEMNWSPSLIVTYPTGIGMSLEKRIIPRCSVFKVLISKSLWKKKVSLRMLLGSSEEKFLEKHIAPYEKEAPELLILYEGKLAL